MCRINGRKLNELRISRGLSQRDLAEKLNISQNMISQYENGKINPSDDGVERMAVTESVECDEPFIRHPRERDYMMLSRLENDCKYFLGNGNGYEGHLYYKEVNEHCDEMKNLYESFSDGDKPEWISLEKIDKYRKEMLEKRRR